MGKGKVVEKKNAGSRSSSRNQSLDADEGLNKRDKKAQEKLPIKG